MAWFSSFRALRSHRAVRSSVPSTDRRVMRAARSTVEALERRVLLTALPSTVHASADAQYVISGDATSGYAVTLSAGTFSFDDSVGAAGNVWQNLSLTVTGSATLALNTQQTFSSLTLSGSAKVIDTGSGGGWQGGTHQSQGNLLIIGPGGLSFTNDPNTGLPTATLDLGDNDMILQGAGAAYVTQLRTMLHRSLGSSWAGPGLTSSAAAAASSTSAHTALGYGLNDGSVPGIHYTVFDGVNVAASDVLVKYTLVGDTNLDGLLNNVDFTRFSNAYNAYAGQATSWGLGDFDYDGLTTSADYTLFSNNFGQVLVGPNLARTIVPSAQPITAVEGQPFSGTVATFTDTLNTASSPNTTTVGSYTASISWGDGNFLPATVTADTNPNDPGGFVVTPNTPSVLNNPDALIVAQVQYTAASGFQGRPGALGEPLVLLPDVPSNLTAVSSGVPVMLTWTPPAGPIPVAGYDVWRNGTKIGSTIAAAYQDDTAQPNTTYTYTVYSKDAFGNMSQTAAGLSVAVGSSSTVTLTAPGGLAITSVTDSSVTLHWTASTGATGPITYEVAREAGVAVGPLTDTNFVVLGAITGTAFTDSGLDAATPYLYRVIAYDPSENKSAPATVSATTAADQTAPSAPSTVTVTANTVASISLSWSASSDNVGVTGYEVFRTGVIPASATQDLGSTSSTTFIDSAVVPESQYTYSVTAFDAANNRSASTSSVTVTAMAAPLADQATNQYVPSDWQNYFYNTLTPRLRVATTGSILPPAAQGWLDLPIPSSSGSIQQDTLIVNQTVVTNLPVANNVYFTDANRNGVFDPGETAWIVTPTGTIVLSGTTPNTQGSTGLRYIDVNKNGVCDPGEVILANINAVQGTQGQLAYRDVTGVGHWVTGDPIWHDANNDSRYDAGDEVLYGQTPTPGTWGKKQGLNFYDRNGNGTGNAAARWQPNDVFIWVDKPSTFNQDFAAFYNGLDSVITTNYDPNPALDNGLQPPPFLSVGAFLKEMGAPTNTPTGGQITSWTGYGSTGLQALLNGTNTHFLSELTIGDNLLIGSTWYFVAAVNSDTQVVVNLPDLVHQPLLGAGVPVVFNGWTKVPTQAATASTPAFAYAPGQPDASSPVFPQQFQELSTALSALGYKPPYYDIAPFDSSGGSAFISAATSVINTYETVFGAGGVGTTDYTVKQFILNGGADPGAITSWQMIVNLRAMVGSVAGAVYVRDPGNAASNGWKMGGNFNPNQPPELNAGIAPMTFSDWWGNHWIVPPGQPRTKDSSGNDVYLQEIAADIQQILNNGLWISVGSSTYNTDSYWSSAAVGATGYEKFWATDDPNYPYGGNYPNDLSTWTEPDPSYINGVGSIDVSKQFSAGAIELDFVQRHQFASGYVDWSGLNLQATMPVAKNDNHGALPSVLHIGPESAGLSDSGWTWGGSYSILVFSAADAYALTLAHYPPPVLPPNGTGNDLFQNYSGSVPDSGLMRGISWKVLSRTIYSGPPDYSSLADYGGAVNVHAWVPAPSVYGEITPLSPFSYTPPTPPSPPTYPSLPSTPLPLTDKVDYLNVVQDTNLDDIVQVDHNQITFGPDTGSIGFQAQRDMPQVYLPLNTDGDSTNLPIHNYIAQGGFGTAQNDVGGLATNYWTYPDANENGQPYADSLDTRVQVNLLVNDQSNHVKRIEVVRPRGNPVVFDFPWDAAGKVFKPIGNPVGIDSSRLYVLRDLTPADNTDNSYALEFASGIVQTFGGAGRLASIGNADGLSTTAPAALAFSPSGAAPAVSSPRYSTQINWSGGTISSLDYTASAGTPAQTIQTTLGYGGGNSAADINSLSKGVKASAANPADLGTAIPEFSWQVVDSGRTTIAANNGGLTILRTGSFASGQVNLRSTVSGVAGYSLQQDVFNSDGLLTSATSILSEDGTNSTSATTTYAYQSGRAYYANGSPQWGKLADVTYPDGSWEHFNYDPSTGWVTEDITPFMDGTAAQGGPAGVDVTYNYNTAQTGGDVADPTRLVERPRVATTTTQGIVTGTAYFKYNGPTVTRGLAPSNAATSNPWGSAVLKSTTTIDTNGYSTVAGAARVAGSANDTGSSFGSAWGYTSLSEVDTTTNAFGGLIESDISGLGRNDVIASGGQWDAFGRTLQASLDNGLTSSASGFSWFGPSTSTGTDNLSTALSYTPLGQLLSSTSAGVKSSFTYDAAGNLLSETDDGAGNATSANPDVTVTNSATYDAQGRATSSTDALGHKTTFVYDDAAHTITTTHLADGSTEVDSYYVDGSPKAVSGTAVTPSQSAEGVSPNGDTWTATSTDGGKNWSYSYTNILGQTYKQTTPTPDTDTIATGPTTPSAANDNNVAVATTLFDGNGRPYQTTGFDGTVAKTLFDAATGQVSATILDTTQTSGSSSKNGASRKTTYKYLTNVTDNGLTYSGTAVTDVSSSGSVTTVYEEANGGLDTREVDQATLDSNGHVTGGLITTTHTAVNASVPGGATVTTTNPDNTQTVDSYANDLLTTENQLGTNGGTVTTQSFGYDALNRNTSSTDPVFGKTSWTLRPDGSVSGSTLPGHNPSTVTTADPTTQIPTAATRPDGGTQSQGVNLLGQVTSQSGAGLTASTYGYDSNTGQLNDLKLYPSGDPNNASGVQHTQWKYDDATGALLSKTYADGSVNTSGYNGVRLTSLSQAGIGSGNNIAYAYKNAFGYNTAGEQTSSRSTDNATQQSVTDTVNSQDDQGRPTIITGQTTDAQGRPTSSATNVFTYSNGNLTGESQAAGVTVAYDYYGVNDHGTFASPGALKAVRLVKGGQTISTTTYQYDGATGRLQNIVVNGQTYAVGYLTGTNLVNSIGNPTVSTSFGYETGTGRLSSISTSGGGALLYSAGYTYTQNDQRLTDTTSLKNADGSIATGVLTYGYDSLDELDSVTGTSSYSYTYDGVGNRTNTAYGVANSLNQYSNISYNTRGDEKDDGTFSYTWDADGHMTLATADDNSVKVASQFDGQGRRVEKDVYLWNTSLNGGTGGWALSYTRKFAYAGGRLAAELDGNNQLVTGYTWVAGTLIAATDYTGTVPKVYTVVTDGSGNVVALVDPNTGQVAASYIYDPLGKVLTATGPAAGVCSILFGQGYMDRETGLILLGARFYSPVQDRFISRDPSGESGGLNLYPYAGNDPINFNDPSGNAPQADGPPVDLNDVPFYGPVSLSRNQLGILGHTVIQGYSRTNYYYIIGGKAYPAVFVGYKHMPDPTAPGDYPWTPGAADSYERTLKAENAAWGVSFIGVRASADKASTTVAWPSTQEDPVATDFLRRALSPAGRGAAYLAQASENVPIFGPIFSALYHEITGSFGELGGDAFQFAMDVWSTWDAAVAIKSLGTVASAVLKAGLEGGASAAAGISGILLRSGRPLTSAEKLAISAIDLAKQQTLAKDVQRALLREALQAGGTGKVAHHLIPLEAESKYGALLQKAAEGGFNINGANNGILLREADHVFGHPQYNRAVLDALNQIPTNLSPKDTGTLLQKTADVLRKAIEDGIYGPWGMADEVGNPGWEAWS